MTVSAPPPLSNDEARALYERLLADDPTAPSDLAVAYLDRLADWLIAYNPNLDPHDCATAAEDAILALIKDPKTYKPERQTLEIYLRIQLRATLRTSSVQKAATESVRLIGKPSSFLPKRGSI